MSSCPASPAPCTGTLTSYLGQLACHRGSMPTAFVGLTPVAFAASDDQGLLHQPSAAWQIAFVSLITDAVQQSACAPVHHDCLSGASAQPIQVQQFVHTNVESSPGGLGWQCMTIILSGLDSHLMLLCLDDPLNKQKTAGGVAIWTTSSSRRPQRRSHSF